MYLIKLPLLSILSIVTVAFISQRKPLQKFSVSTITLPSETDINPTLSFNTIPSANEDQASSSNPNTLNVFQRLSRAVSFYSAAIPIFAAYKGASYAIQVKRDFFNEQITPEDETIVYEKLHDWGSDKIVDKINELKGFYVKTGQIISTRVDIFPSQYTSKLSITQDQLDPLPGSVIKEIVKRELLNGAELSELFSEFDDLPLGSASIAQVHRARLLDGRVVAVKVQRPGIQGKLLGDIANLKNFAKIIGDALLIDYYKIFTEIEKTLIYELDFLHEAQATNKIAAAVCHTPSNARKISPPVIVPLPLPGLVSKHVLVLEFIDGKPLSKISGEMEKRGISAGSMESKLLGLKLLESLSDAYGNMIFGSGIIHGDPHPGNIFILPDGQVALLDCGQVKQITTAQRLGLAKVIVLVHAWENLSRQVINLKKDATVNLLKISEKQAELDIITRQLASIVRSFGVTFKEGAGDNAAAAVALLLFGHTDNILPGGYKGEEISLDSPIVQVIEFPSELVLLGRATVMMKGIANRLKMSWGLTDRWHLMAQEMIDSVAKGPEKLLPVWSVSRPMISSPSPMLVGSGASQLSSRSSSSSNGGSSTGSSDSNSHANQNRIRFRDVQAGFVMWWQLCKEYMSKKAMVVVQRSLPKPALNYLIKMMARMKGLKDDDVKVESSALVTASATR